MPIHGLTSGEARWGRIGILRKGAPKPSDRQPGADLGESLRFVGNDETVNEAWTEAFGPPEKGQLLVDTLSVRLPYPTVDRNWQAWREHWVAGGLKYRCDGLLHVLWLDRDGAYRHDAQPCPGASCEAKPVGRLELIIPDLRRMGTVTLLTTSRHDIMALDGCLRALALAFGDLSLVPLQLTRVKRMISTPASGGKRARREKWLLHLEADPAWVGYMLDARGEVPAHLLPRIEVAALPAPSNGHEDADGGDEDPDAEGGAESAVAAAGAHDLTVPDPTGHGDLQPLQGGPKAPSTEPTGEPEVNGWRTRLDACKAVLDVERLLVGEIATVEPAACRENVRRVAYRRIVALVGAAVARTDGQAPAKVAEVLAVADQKLATVPADTPGVGEAQAQVATLRHALVAQAEIVPA